jgi:molecular chaperone GrpE (heat shock protein)
MSAIARKKTTAKSVKPVVSRPKAKSIAKPAAKSIPPVRPAVKPAQATPPPARSEVTGIETLRAEMADLRAAVEKSLSPIASGAMDEVDALRRVLSYLFEARTEEMVRALVAIRHAAASIPEGGRNVTGQIDALLADLGAVKFQAEPLEHVDPLIHAITREVRDETLEDSVIVEAIRSGFRTGRGIVIAKALVAINRRT